MTDQDDERPIGFEDGMARLEALVAELEAGDLALEDALRAFETGVGLVRKLNDQLTKGTAGRGADARAGWHAAPPPRG
jgi:exodeoxyribonuclease VII small subunit